MTDPYRHALVLRNQYAGGILTAEDALLAFRELLTTLREDASEQAYHAHRMAVRTVQQILYVQWSAP